MNRVCSLMLRTFCVCRLSLLFLCRLILLLGERFEAQVSRFKALPTPQRDVILFTKHLINPISSWHTLSLFCQKLIDHFICPVTVGANLQIVADLDNVKPTHDSKSRFSRDKHDKGSPSRFVYLGHTLPVPFSHQASKTPAAQIV